MFSTLRYCPGILPTFGTCIRFWTPVIKVLADSFNPFQPVFVFAYEKNH